MTAIIRKFPHHPVHVARDADDAEWLVCWRENASPYASYAEALADAHRIAFVHGERVVVHTHKNRSGGAA